MSEPHAPGDDPSGAEMKRDRFIGHIFEIRALYFTLGAVAGWFDLSWPIADFVKYGLSVLCLVLIGMLIEKALGCQ